jgi:Macrocin-O-methyltransferase (TylF)
MIDFTACRTFKDRLKLLSRGMSLAAPTGQVLEFGVDLAYTTNHIAGLTPRTVYGFDSFLGLPEDWRPGFDKGFFYRNNKFRPVVAPNVELVVGLFADTLPRFVADHTVPIAFLHVDCDLYSSTKTVFQWLQPLIVSGTVIVFDEYHGYPTWQQHEYRAFQEFVADNDIKYHYDSHVIDNEQVCVVIDQSPAG